VYKNRELGGRYTRQVPVTDLGCSESALIATIAWGCVLVAVCLLIAGICTYLKGMPTGGTNSAVISAACHVRYTDGDEVQALDEVVNCPLQWGARFRVRRRKLVIAVSATRKLRSQERNVFMLEA
jgi:hypothetical protein